MPKKPTVENSIRAVLAAGAATRIREGMAWDEATKQTHDAMREQIRRKLATSRDREAVEG